MENLRLDFIKYLGPDTSTTVLTLLDDPGDLVRVSAVSRSWRRFEWTQQIFPEVSSFTHIEVCNSSKNRAEDSSSEGSSSGAEWISLEREHKVYSRLSHLRTLKEGKMDCIQVMLCASSTDNFPDESIENTLESSELVDLMLSYWSSGGQKDSRVPESLTYKLKANLCLVNEIKIQPFKAFFQYGCPIYSSKFIRFHMGNLRPIEALKSRVVNGHTECLANGENFVWTYVSPEFPIVQENVLQSFALPEPIICIGGILQIELMVVQKQAMDDLYYICVIHVKVVGQPLLPLFDVDIQEAEGWIVLKYFLHATPMPLVAPSSLAEDKTGDASPWQTFRDRLWHLQTSNNWHQSFLDVLFGPIHFPDDEYDDREDSTDGSDVEGFSQVTI